MGRVSPLARKAASGARKGGHATVIPAKLSRRAAEKTTYRDRFRRRDATRREGERSGRGEKTEPKSATREKRATRPRGRKAGENTRCERTRLCRNTIARCARKAARVPKHALRAIVEIGLATRFSAVVPEFPRRRGSAPPE